MGGGSRQCAKAEKDLPSVGSTFHDIGVCKPCAWFWKPKSCLNGSECRHCHLCPQDELKRRRNMHKATSQRKRHHTTPCEAMVVTDDQSRRTRLSEPLRKRDWVRAKNSVF